MEALKPHRNLQSVKFRGYKGSRLPRWMSSPMGKLALLEKVEVMGLRGLEVVGVEWLEIRRGGGGGGDVACPKLKKLTFLMCGKWREWEDLTAEEEESAAVRVMPCLADLNINSCNSLKMLPRRLLRKAECLREINIAYSSELCKCYGHRDYVPN